MKKVALIVLLFMFALAEEARGQWKSVGQGQAPAQPALQPGGSNPRQLGGAGQPPPSQPALQQGPAPAPTPAPQAPVAQPPPPAAPVPAPQPKVIELTAPSVPAVTTQAAVVPAPTQPKFAAQISSVGTFFAIIPLALGLNVVTATVTAGTGDVEITSPAHGAIRERATTTVGGKIFGDVRAVTVTLKGALGPISDTINVTRVNPHAPDFLGIWAKLKTALGAGNDAAALALICVRSRAAYVERLKVLGAVPGFELGGQLVLVSMRAEEAVFEVVRSGQSFEVRFEKDEDGLWRVASF